LLVVLAGALAQLKLTGGDESELLRVASREGALVERCRAWIENPQPWAAICQVAAALLEQRTLSEPAVRKLVLACEW
jgi:hypothetical protein